MYNSDYHYFEDYCDQGNIKQGLGLLETMAMDCLVIFFLQINMKFVESKKVAKFQQMKRYFFIRPEFETFL